MRKLLTALLPLIAASAITSTATAHAKRYKGHVVTCISGDCTNGSAVAIVSMNSEYKDDTRDQLHYTGTFKDGLMDGEGVAWKTQSSYYASNEKPTLYTGHFTEGDLDGYCIIWTAKRVGENLVQDSTEAVCFTLYKQGIARERATVGIDGTIALFDNAKKIKDDGLKTRVEAYVAARKGKFAPVGTPTATPVIIAENTLNAVRGQAITCLTWNCLTDRKYFLTAGAMNGNKMTSMPFGGSVSYQVLDADNNVVFEAAADTYWHPTKDGNYTFLLKFVQGEILGNGNLYVDAVRIKWSLRSRSL